MPEGPLVVRFSSHARQEFRERASHDRVSRGRSAVLLAAIVAGLVLVPWVGLAVVQGFEPRTLPVLVLLVLPAVIARWGLRMQRAQPPSLGEIAFVVDARDVRFEELPFARAGMRPAPPVTWPRGETTVEVRSSRLLGERVVLSGPGRQRRAYATSMLDTTPAAIRATVAGAAR